MGLYDHRDRMPRRRVFILDRMRWKFGVAGKMDELVDLLEGGDSAGEFQVKSFQLKCAMIWNASSRSTSVCATGQRCSASRITKSASASQPSYFFLPARFAGWAFERLVVRFFISIRTTLIAPPRPRVTFKPLGGVLNPLLTRLRSILIGHYHLSSFSRALAG